MKKLKLLLLSILILSACSDRGQNDVEIDSYKESEINDEIPVPANAVASEVKYDNPNIEKGMQYNLENIGGEQGLYPPHIYFDEMKNWGWEEVGNQQMGHGHYFEKGDKVILIIIREDYFTLYEMKETFEFN